MYKFFFKGLLDFLLALLGLILLLPVWSIVMVGLFIVNKGNPFFLQDRPGLNAKVFRIIKFKTMNDKKDENGELLADKDRLTHFGAFVRRCSLDEIPQLINVLKGDMSLIGPRPLRTFYLPIYNEDQKKRHDVKPGITGWAQVNGRNAITWTKKLELDVYYVQNLCFSLDVRIFFLTIKKVIYSEGISQDGQATVERFNGEN